MTIGERIKQSRLDKSMTLEDVSKRAGVSRQTIFRYESGEIKNIPSDKIEKIAKALDVSPAYLMGWEEKGNKRDEHASANHQDNHPEVKKFKGRLYVHLPVLGRVAGGTPIEQIDTGDYEDFEDFEIRPGEENDYFALRVAGQSMQPLIWDGSVVIVRKQPDAESGEIVVITIDGEDATCKRLKKYEDGIALLSENPSYKPMVYRASEISGLPIRILGKVVEVRTEIR